MVKLAIMPIFGKIKFLIENNKYAFLVGAFVFGILIGYFFFLATQPTMPTEPGEPVIEDLENPGTNNGTTSATSTRGIVKGIISNISEIIRPDKKDGSTTPVKLNIVMTWIYPGVPACSASEELADGRRVDILKPEYFRIDSGGVLTFLDEENHGCNGFSSQNINLIKTNSAEQYVTVASSDTPSMDAFLRRDIATGEHTKTLVDFAVQNSFEGVELDFEDFGGWDKASYENYKTFVRNLGNALHAQNKKLMIDGPATSNSMEESWFIWRYSDFIPLPVDYIVIMAYDYQFDHGVGVPVSPLSWIEDVIKWTTSRFPDKSRLVVGLPSYGYYGTIGRNNPKIITFEEAKTFPGFETAKRDEKSGEMTWRNGGNFYVYQDSESLNRKIEVVLKNGIGNISIWHLGGNNWF